MKFFHLLAVSFLLLSTNQQTYADSDLEKLRKEFRTELLQPNVNSNEIESLINTINPNGTWPGINYKDVSRTGFQQREHLSNLVDLSRAYKKPGSQFQGDEKLKKIIDLALNYWLANDFICDNWWWNQIGTPTAMVSVLLIMDTDLTDLQIAKALPIVGRATLTEIPGTFYGARESGDRVNIAGIVAKQLLFERDSVQFNKVVKVIEGEIKFTTGRGLQYDYSFHHRDDRVNNTLSYGTNYANVFAEWAAKVTGTKYQFSQHAIQMLVDYYLDGICKMMVYGKYPDPGALNRGITRAGATNAFSSATPERLLKATVYRKKELQEIVSIRKGEAKPNLSFSRFYWQTEHFTFQRHDYFTSVRMYSDRDYNMEEPYNGEGLMNHYRGDGTNYISRTGKEYDDISPVYDWQKIPGATIMQRTEMPDPKEIQKKGLTDFVGAVTDGRYGAVGFDFKSPIDPLSAKKSWFFFNDEYVCLGTGISGDSNLSVATTLNQCLLKGNVTVMSADKKSIAQKGEHQLKNVQWILHDSIGYLFPKSANVNLSNQAQTGSWYKVNHQSDSPKDEISMNVFKLWFDHGTHPKDATYEYIVVPATTEQKLTKESQNSGVVVLANTPNLQAVRNTKLNISEAVFYTEGTIAISNKLKLIMNNPGIVMVKTNGSSIKSISVEDPTRKLTSINLSISTKLAKHGNNFKASWDENKKASIISIDLPKTNYAGESVTINF